MAESETGLSDLFKTSLFEELLERKREKRSNISIECDSVMLIDEMKNNCIRGERVRRQKK